MGDFEQNRENYYIGTIDLTAVNTELIDSTQLLQAISTSGNTLTTSAASTINTINTGWTTTNIAVDDMDLENAVTIDIPELDKDSTETAERIVKDMEGLYYDDEWLESHPRIKKRIDIELESLRSLIKLRKANEQAHDAILNGISSENSNASLYRALGEIQRTSLSITKQIDETVTKLEDMLQQYQMAVEDGPVQINEDEDDIEDTSPTHRGSKSFIKEQIKRSED